jgi:hypothetical protein
VLSSKSESLVQLFRIFNNENYNSDGCRVRLEPSFLLDREANKIVKLVISLLVRKSSMWKLFDN